MFITCVLLIDVLHRFIETILVVSKHETIGVGTFVLEPTSRTRNVTIQ